MLHPRRCPSHQEKPTPRAVHFDFWFKITLGLSTYSPSVVFNWIITRCMRPSTAVYKIKVCFLCFFFFFSFTQFLSISFTQFEQRAHRCNNREAFGTLSGVFRELRLSLYANVLKSLRSRIGKLTVLFEQNATKQVPALLIWLLMTCTEVPSHSRHGGAGADVNLALPPIFV